MPGKQCHPTGAPSSLWKTALGGCHCILNFFNKNLGGFVSHLLTGLCRASVLPSVLLPSTGRTPALSDVQQAGTHAEQGLPWSAGSASRPQVGTHHGPRDTSVRLAQVADGFPRNGCGSQHCCFLFRSLRGILRMESKSACHGTCVLWRVLLCSRCDLCHSRMAVRFPWVNGCSS